MPLGSSSFSSFSIAASRLAGAVARGRGAVEFGGDEAVVVHHTVRTGGVADLDEGRQRDHLAEVVAHLQLADLLGFEAELLPAWTLT